MLEKCKSIASQCDSIPYNEVKYNLHNNCHGRNVFGSIIGKIMLHCDCEVQIRECFRDVSLIFANSTGEYFYNMKLCSNCFKEEYPIVKCVEYDTHRYKIDERCIRYELDESKSKTYQLFDVPHYHNHIDPTLLSASDNSSLWNHLLVFT